MSKSTMCKPNKGMKIKDFSLLKGNKYYTILLLSEDLFFPE
ncbi:MAG: hypothetical protein JWQ14_3006 [Adhaeribacter sp.]|nr:hypothetical protein [Adhaeribacter sp.]